MANTRHRAGPDGLTPRERAFVKAYIITVLETKGKGNATQAAIMIGCPEKTASTRGCGFMKLRHVQSAIAAHMDTVTAKYDVTIDRIVRELAKMAFTGMSRFARKTDDGHLYFDFSNATDDELDAIEELTVEESTEGSSDNKFNVRKTRFKLSRKAALELLGRHHSMFTDNVAMHDPDGITKQPIIVQFVDAEDGHEKKTG